MELGPVGLDAWIIQDGNYGDFERGEVAEFALEFTLPVPSGGDSPSGAEVAGPRGSSLAVAVPESPVVDVTATVACRGGFASYVLHCRRLEDPPRRHRR